MIGATWNIRGLLKRGKLQCITDFIKDNNLDFVSFQETKKESFEDSFLNYASGDFVWNYLPTEGTAGGILVGINERKFEALAWQKTKFYVSVMIKNCDTKLVWRFITVYGPLMKKGNQILFKSCMIW